MNLIKSSFYGKIESCREYLTNTEDTVVTEFSIYNYGSLKKSKFLTPFNVFDRIWKLKLYPLNDRLEPGSLFLYLDSGRKVEINWSFSVLQTVSDRKSEMNTEKNKVDDLFVTTDSKNEFGHDICSGAVWGRSSYLLRMRKSKAYTKSFVLRVKMVINTRYRTGYRRYEICNIPGIRIFDNPGWCDIKVVCKNDSEKRVVYCSKAVMENRSSYFRERVSSFSDFNNTNELPNSSNVLTKTKTNNQNSNAAKISGKLKTTYTTSNGHFQNLRTTYTANSLSNGNCNNKRELKKNSSHTSNPELRGEDDNCSRSKTVSGNKYPNKKSTRRKSKFLNFNTDFRRASHEVRSVSFSSASVGFQGGGLFERYGVMDDPIAIYVDCSYEVVYYVFYFLHFGTTIRRNNCSVNTQQNMDDEDDINNSDLCEYTYADRIRAKEHALMEQKIAQKIDVDLMTAAYKLALRFDIPSLKSQLVFQMSLIINLQNFQKLYFFSVKHTLNDLINEIYFFIYKQKKVNPVELLSVINQQPGALDSLLQRQFYQFSIPSSTQSLDSACISSQQTVNDNQQCRQSNTNSHHQSLKISSLSETFDLSSDEDNEGENNHDDDDDDDDDDDKRKYDAPLIITTSAPNFKHSSLSKNIVPDISPFRTSSAAASPVQSLFELSSMSSSSFESWASHSPQLTAASSNSNSPSQYGCLPSSPSFESRASHSSRWSLTSPNRGVGTQTIPTEPTTTHSTVMTLSNYTSIPSSPLETQKASLRIPTSPLAK